MEDRELVNAFKVALLTSSGFFLLIAIGLLFYLFLGYTFSVIKIYPSTLWLALVLVGAIQTLYALAVYPIIKKMIESFVNGR